MDCSIAFETAGANVVVLLRIVYVRLEKGDDLGLLLQRQLIRRINDAIRNMRVELMSDCAFDLNVSGL